ncbi:MAG TPA: DUF1570 domain-containing protein [Gemmataceae bacterium]|nr:DUF1570 domain-containing protein [Gemmataceae bacterium]
MSALQGLPGGLRLIAKVSWLSFRFALLPILLIGLHAGVSTGAEDDWQFDIVYLKKGGAIKGLVVRESSSEVLLWMISRKPGERAFARLWTEPKEEIQTIEKLEGEERQVLVERVRSLDPTGKLEAERMKSIQLKPIPWGKEGKGWRYASIFFVLESNAGEDLVRRAAVGLDQIYSAYSRYLPARHESGEPTRIILAKSLDDYQSLLKDKDKNLLNPAFFNAASNTIHCGTELQKLGNDMERARRLNQKLLDDLDERKADLNRVYKKVPADLLKEIEDKRKQIQAAKSENEIGFESCFRTSTRRLMQRLYHEAFHAYLANFVYPPTEAEVPIWLNEGLAEVFDSSFLDGNELRIGHADKERLKRVRSLLSKGERVSLADILKSTPKQFLVHHATEKEESDRYYLMSWGLAHYLMFDRQLLGTKALDEYVETLHQKKNPLEAFRLLVDEPLNQFEKELQVYLEQLTPEGKTAKSREKK